MSRTAHHFTEACTALTTAGRDRDRDDEMFHGICIPAMQSPEVNMTWNLASALNLVERLLVIGQFTNNHGT